MNVFRDTPDKMCSGKVRTTLGGLAGQVDHTILCVMGWYEKLVDRWESVRNAVGRAHRVSSFVAHAELTILALRHN